MNTVAGMEGLRHHTEARRLFHPPLQPSYLTSPVTRCPKLSKSLLEPLLRNPVFTRHENTLPRHGANIATAFFLQLKAIPGQDFKNASTSCDWGVQCFKVIEKARKEAKRSVCKTFFSSLGVMGKAPTSFSRRGTRLGCGSLAW